MVIGYRIPVTAVCSVHDALENVSRLYRNRAEKKYRALLAEEIAAVCDEVSLGMVDIGNETIYGVATQRLGEKINVSMQFDLEGDYNFSLFVYVVDGEKGDDHTYFSVQCRNDEYLRAFKQMEEYGVDAAEAMDMANAKTKFWSTVQKRYATISPMTVNLTYVPQAPSVGVGNKGEGTSAFSYPSVRERAQRLAEDMTITEFFGYFGGGKEIEPYHMGGLIRRAVKAAYESERGKIDTANRMQGYQQQLTDLNESDAVIYVPGGKEIPSEEDIPEEKRVFATGNAENTPSAEKE